jgi:hypothetical protein
MIVGGMGGIGVNFIWKVWNSSYLSTLDPFGWVVQQEKIKICKNQLMSKSQFAIPDFSWKGKIYLTAVLYKIKPLPNKCICCFRLVLSLRGEVCVNKSNLTLPLFYWSVCNKPGKLAVCKNQLMSKSQFAIPDFSWKGKIYLTAVKYKFLEINDFTCTHNEKQLCRNSSNIWL